MRYLIAILIITGLSSMWHLDKQRTKISFSVKHLNLYDVKGRFREFDGTLEGDNLEDATITGIIVSESIYTAHRDRDKHLRSEDFLDTDTFRGISFVSTKITKGRTTYKIEGELTIKGKTQKIELIATERFRGSRRYLIADGTINRYDFNVDWDSILTHMVSKDVILNLRLVFFNNPR